MLYIKRYFPQCAALLGLLSIDSATAQFTENPNDGGKDEAPIKESVDRPEYDKLTLLQAQIREQYLATPVGETYFPPTEIVGGPTRKLPPYTDPYWDGDPLPSPIPELPEYEPIPADPSCSYSFAWDSSSNIRAGVDSGAEFTEVMMGFDGANNFMSGVFTIAEADVWETNVISMVVTAGTKPDREASPPESAIIMMDASTGNIGVYEYNFNPMSDTEGGFVPIMTTSDFASFSTVPNPDTGELTFEFTADWTDVINWGEDRSYEPWDVTFSSQFGGWARSMGGADLIYDENGALKSTDIHWPSSVPDGADWADFDANSYWDISTPTGVVVECVPEPSGALLGLLSGSLLLFRRRR